MKKLSFLSALLTFFFPTFSQDMGQLFTSDEFVWCGLDYSEVRCIGPDFNDPIAIKEKYFEAWNELMFTESSKYDFKEAYQKTKQTNDLTVVSRRNQTVDVDEFIIKEDYEFKDGQLKAIIADYDLKKAEEGIGLVYVFETLNKRDQAALLNVVFFDIATKEIIWASKYKAPAAGFGFRNYWARPIYEVIKDSKKLYKKKQKKYLKSQK